MEKISIKPIKDLNNILNKNVKAIASSASSISTIMSTSKGRDKICALIQTSANFYIHCIKYSNIDETKAAYNSETLIGYQIGEKIKESMSKGRKIFKFLKFLQEIKGIQKNMKKKKRFGYKALLIAINVMNFFYYILDNILWGINVGILSNVISKHHEKIYKDYKNQFSYMKFVFKIFKNIVNLVLRQRKENEIQKGMQFCDENVITVFDDSYDLCRVFLKERRKKRFEIFEIIISSMRIIPLTRSLKLPGYKWMNPVFVSFCGMFSAALKIFYMVLNKKESGSGKKQEKNKDNDEEEENIDVKGFFSKTKKNLKSSNVRKKIQKKSEKDKSINDSDSSDSSKEDKGNRNRKQSKDEVKNMMADFMRKSLNVKHEKGNRRKSVLSAADNESNTLTKRVSVMSEQNLGGNRRRGVMAKGFDKKTLDIKSTDTLENLEESDKE